ncbi:MAG: cysteine desulfurase [Minwuiales bacterium]|nr:cysteine desulfurase [Minwuiales bacterium]
MTVAGAYLDYNATAPLRPEAADAVSEALAEGGNPSSVHASGRAARHRVEQARAAVAGLVGVAPRQVAFTSGGTEANHTALNATQAERLIVSAIEHDSVLAPARNANPDIDILPVGADGLVDPAALERLLADDPRPALVSVMLANNETGVVQPVADVAALAHEHSAVVHCDAVQAAGKLPVDFDALGVDMLSLSGHKLGAPTGVGALVLAEAMAFSPRQTGGGQEFGRRAGTENLVGIAGMGAAATAAAMLADTDRLRALRDDLEARLLGISPGSRVFGAEAPRLPNTSCITMPGVSAELQVMALDLAGVAVSAGAACSSGKVQASHVLRAIGAGEEAAASAIRISTGWATTPADIDRLVEAWSALYQRKHAA